MNERDFSAVESWKLKDGRSDGFFFFWPQLKKKQRKNEKGKN